MRNAVIIFVSVLLIGCTSNKIETQVSEIGTWEFKYSDSEWLKAKVRVLSDSDFELRHFSDSAYLFAVSQIDSIDVAMLEYAAIEKFNSALASGKLLRRTEETINNAHFLRIAFIGFEGNNEVVYDGVFYTGQQGTIQVFMRAHSSFYRRQTEFIDQTFRNIYLK